MNTNAKWGLAMLASVAAAVAITVILVRKDPATPVQNAGQNPDQKSAPAEDKVKILVALSKALVQFTHDSRPTILARLLDEADRRTPSGKKIEIERVAMSSAEMVDGLLNGSLKAHIIVPSNAVYLDLLDREWTLRTGKPLTSARMVVAQQPYILAVRRSMAEALGWPTKDVGWPEVIKVARDGWKTVGHPEWGSLKLLMLNPNYSDMGMHALVSIARGVMQKSKGLTSADLADPALAEALKAINNAVVWFPASIDDLLRNEVLTVPPRCDMVFLAEHHLVTLNDHSARRKAPPDWVGIYPAKGTVMDPVTAAVVQREWVTKEQREAAVLLAQNFMKPEVQKRLVSIGFRPALKEIALTAPFTEAMGINPKLPEESFETPPVELVLDCLSAWDKVWKARVAEVSGTKEPVAAARPVASTPVSMKKLSHLTPTIQCVRRAKPCTVTIRDPNTNKVRGTGVLIDARGYAVTNYHVVGTDKTVAVSFLDSTDKVLKGEVPWSDQSQDLAIVRLLTPGKYPAIKYGDSGEREVGETVIAIGNPLGYTGTVTVGIISALDREITIPSGHVLTKLIQTSAPINPGNSGGPLLDIDGQLVGIVFAVREGAQNIAFAIPVDRVRAYMKKHLPE
jgi:S1-C subfamily serine protease